MNYIDDLCERRKGLSSIKYDIVEAYETLKKCYDMGNKVLICGNGGSASDAAHITGELMKSFKKKRTIDEVFEKKLLTSIEQYREKNGKRDSYVILEDMKKNLECGLPTIDVTAFTGLNTAFSNDKNFDFAFANVVLGLGKKDDVLIAITTSGNSKNIINASLVAKALGMKVIALTGFDGGLIKDIADISVIVPINETYLIQEEHLAIYHALCLELEDKIF